MNGNINISTHRINDYFERNNVPIVAHSFLGKGSFGAAFCGVLKRRIPVVIKVALSYPDAHHTLKDEMKVYNELGQYHELNDNIVTEQSDAVGVCYYYGVEDVDRRDNLDWKKSDIHISKNIAHSRPKKCVEQKTNKHREKCRNCHRHKDPEQLLGLCDDPENCKGCRRYYVQLHVLVMSQFGESLSHIEKAQRKIHKQKRTLNVSTVAKLMVSGIVKLQWLHSRGYVHRDMKASNIVIPITPTNPTYADIYLIDLGLTKKWQEGPLGQHIPYQNKTDKHTGTIYYIGTHAHSGDEASRRDDLQALGIIGLDALMGDLPWDKHDRAYKRERGSRNSNRKSVKELKLQRDRKMLQEKHDFLKHIHKHTKHLPKEFKEFLIYSHDLEFDEDPDYEMWIQKFVHLIDKNNWTNDKVEWADRLSVTKQSNDNNNNNNPNNVNQRKVSNQADSRQASSHIDCHNGSKDSTDNTTDNSYIESSCSCQEEKDGKHNNNHAHKRNDKEKKQTQRSDKRQSTNNARQQQQQYIDRPLIGNSASLGERRFYHPAQVMSFVSQYMPYC